MRALVLVAIALAGLQTGLGIFAGGLMAEERNVLYPNPPCAGAPVPDYPAIGDPPNIRVWRDAQIQGWRNPACLEFAPLEANTVVATAGRFRVAGGIEELAGRVGAISNHTSIRYFSVRDEEWQPLFRQAYAIDDLVSTAPASARRGDFAAADVQTGRTMRFWQEENSLLSPVTYRLTIRERTENRLVYTIVNETAGKAMFLRAIEPGEFRQLYVLERDESEGNVWRYYSLAEARTKMGPFNLSSRSYINRAGAYFRYIAGLPTDMEPPPAPREK
jgi:hypothetical protein